MRKYESIDLLKLYALGDSTSWNKVLLQCLKNQDINRLAKLRYQISAGMDDLAKANANNDQINMWFLRLMRSIELTAKKIIKVRHPMPGDNVMLKNKAQAESFVEVKRKRDQELQNFLISSSF